MTSLIYPLVVGPTWGGGWGYTLFDEGLLVRAHLRVVPAGHAILVQLHETKQL